MITVPSFAPRLFRSVRRLSASGGGARTRVEEDTVGSGLYFTSACTRTAVLVAGLL